MTSNVKGFWKIQNSKNGIGKKWSKEIIKGNKSDKLSSFLDLWKEPFRRLDVDFYIFVLQDEMILAWPFRAFTLVHIVWQALGGCFCSTVIASLWIYFSFQSNI